MCKFARTGLEIVRHRNIAIAKKNEYGKTRTRWALLTTNGEEIVWKYE